MIMSGCIIGLDVCVHVGVVVCGGSVILLHAVQVCAWCSTIHISHRTGEN